jgi:hypothetical protein
VLTWFIFNTPGGPSAWYSFGGWGVLPLFVLFGIMPLAVWAFVYRKMTDPSMTRRRAAALGLANWPYTFVHYLASWWALVRMLRGRHDWKKTERHGDLATVESPRPAPVAASKTAHARPPQQRPQQPRVPSRPAAAGRAPVAADWENAIVPYVGPKRTVPARPGHAHVRSSAASHFASSTRSGDASATVGTVPVPGVHSQ